MGRSCPPGRFVDWLFLCVVGITLLIVKAVVAPREQYIQKSDWPALMYPHQPNTVPSWSVPVISIVLPMAFFLIVYCVRRDGMELHNMLLGVLSAVLYCGLISETVKRMVGRPRPDFFARCFPNADAQELPQSGFAHCSGALSVIREGMQSFPSGHTAWTAAGLGFLSLWLAANIDPPGSFPSCGWRLWLAAAPLLASAIIGISRVTDYWHHWTDVATGFVLGIACAWVNFRIYHGQITRHQQEMRETKGKQPMRGEEIGMAAL